MLAHIHIGGITIQTFGVFFALNFICWGLVAAKRLVELGKPVDWAYEMVIVAVVGGLIGARAYYLIQNHGSLHGSLLGNVFGGSGLVWYGGLLGGTIAVLVWAKWHDFFSLRLVDIAAVGLPLGYAIGRIGCQVAGDGDYGKPSHLPWAMGYAHGTTPTPPGVTVGPTPIYETLSMGLVAWVLWNWRDRFRPGVLFALYLVFAGIERFLVEFIRRNDHVAAGLTAAQFESLGLALVGTVWLVLAERRGGLRATSSPATGQAALHSA
ncbi:MAG TPA: prolipoprotein diacylglyceryl transferase [Thermoleophilaceae bacterium]